MAVKKHPEVDIWVKVETVVLIDMDQALNGLVALTGISKRSLVAQAVMDFLTAAGVWYPSEDDIPVTRTHGKTRSHTKGKEEK